MRQSSSPQHDLWNYTDCSVGRSCPLKVGLVGKDSGSTYLLPYFFQPSNSLVSGGPFSHKPSTVEDRSFGTVALKRTVLLLLQVHHPAGISRDQAHQLNPLLLHHIKCLELEIPFGRRLVSTIPVP